MAKPKPVKTLPEVTSQPNANGGHLRVGNPGNKGGHGAVPKAFKDFMRDEIRNGFQSRHALVEASQDPESRSFATAWKVATDYDDEKPAEKKQIVGPLEIIVSVRRESRKVTAG